jgi:hypothetical protein
MLSLRKTPIACYSCFSKLRRKPLTRFQATDVKPCLWVPTAPIPAGPCSARLLSVRFHAGPPLHESLPAQSRSATGWVRQRSGEQFGPGKVIGQFALFTLLGWGFSCQVITSSARRPAPDHSLRSYAAAECCLDQSLLHSRQDTPNVKNMLKNGLSLWNMWK